MQNYFDLRETLRYQDFIFSEKSQDYNGTQSFSFFFFIKIIGLNSKSKFRHQKCSFYKINYAIIRMRFYTNIQKESDIT